MSYTRNHGALDGANAEDINTLPFYPSASIRVDVNHGRGSNGAMAQWQRV
jgi:hypothetical protein